MLRSELARSVTSRLPERSDVVTVVSVLVVTVWESM
jgi:hypothetical protein